MKLDLTPPQVKTAKAIAIAVLVAVALGLAGWGVAKFLARWNDGPAQRAAQAKVNEKVEQAGAASFDNAVGQFADHVRERETIKEKETHYVETIHEAAGANDAVPPAVHDAGIAAIRGLRDASGDGNSAAADLPH
jgi:hypothetical protein